MLHLTHFSLKTSTAALARSSVSDSILSASSPDHAMNVPLDLRSSLGLRLGRPRLLARARDRRPCLPEVEALRGLLRGLVEGVVDLLPVHLAHLVEGRVGHRCLLAGGPLQDPPLGCR